MTNIIDYKIIRENSKEGAYILFNTSSKRFDVKNLKKEIEKRENLYNEISLKFEFEYPFIYDINKHYNVKITLDNIVIGEIELVEINTYDDLLFSFDETSDLLQIYNALFYNKLIDENNDLNISNVDYFSKIVVLKKIALQKHKGLGIGKFVIQMLFDYFKKESETLFILKSFPLQYDKTIIEKQNSIDDKLFEKNLEKLDLFYKDLNMIKLSSLKKEDSFFYKILL